MEIECPNCGETVGYELPESFKGNLSCPKCPKSFYAEIEEGKIKAIEFLRKNKIPFLGLCLGMQLAVVEFARNVCAMKKANSTEFSKKTEYPV